MLPGLGKILRRLRQTHEDVARHDIAVHGLEPVRTAVKALTHLAGSEQSAIQCVRPLVIRAYEPGRCAVWRRADSRAPVSAAVDEGTHNAVRAPDDHERIVTDLQRKIAAGAG